MPVCAAENSIPADFDATYYANRYPDVVATLGTDAQALYDHYLAFGIDEGRFKNAEAEQQANLATSTPIDGYSTYVDVDLTHQTVIYFENGVANMSAPCVTGNVNAHRDTPTGVYAICSMIRGTHLVGPTWNVWVDRWMKFVPNRGIGLHDASWRSEFGGDVYKTDGSHGCVNLPHDFAVALYDKVTIGTPVIVHE